MSAQRCPQCGTVRGADGSHGCACAERAAEAVRAGRTAEIAAAEDFDPLRIRPYVTLSETEPAPERAAPPLLGVVQPPSEPVPGPVREAAGHPAETMQLFPLRAAAAGAAPGGADTRSASARRRRRRVPVAAVGAATLAVIGVSAFAAGVFSDGSEVELSMPEVRTSAPAVSVRPDISASTSDSPSPSPSASVSASPTASASASASPTPSASASPSSSKPAAESPSRPPASESAPADPTRSRIPGPPELRYGDEGAEVLELQRRLEQLQLYDGPENGKYGRRVESAVAEFQMYAGVSEDERGVYGAETRSRLESLTHEP
ncbi:peptidoglycan-binding protein [Streptomyces sp. A3M-1-3]|uniref:peptidoglycan-binding domain-containing protein n=1 Tax=Streptomyces sp. A3M-1-3 TaxID=2962044 RepID=UPI0020B6EC35|nr:peptidoglycan-binding protein [Streptomyces sp. A3M-1-3]MCP3816636.1 peptidoglycan-binding protein [Streptomyces sp. A3M-1-3]